MDALPPPPPPTQGVLLNRHACSLCARRKVRCDKGDPCSNCAKAQAQCSYEGPAPYRPRKRAVDDELLSRIALYEGLLRKHNIDFTNYANIWVPSLPVPELKESVPPSPISIVSAASYPKHVPELAGDIVGSSERCLWSDLSHELRYPPFQSLRRKDDPLLCPTPTLQTICLPGQPDIHTLHPEPRHIYRLWQIFVESVNPLTKIIHVPTLQTRVLDASWDPSNVSQPLTAILFAIYTLAVTAISSDSCQDSFGETREVLLTRYRTATLRALIANNFLTTKDVEVLQAFTLFLFADPESELASTLTGAAIRLGLKMGLHREASSTDPNLSFFEREMRIRLWWQLRGLDARVRAVSTPGMHPTPYEFGDVRAPLNLNDADLHPDMAEAPPAHETPTEMVAVLMKYEVSNWLRTSPSTARIFQDIILGVKNGPIETQLEDQAIDELERIYRDKYLSCGDARVPLHALTHAMAKLAVARMRFRVHHPRGRAATTGAEARMTREEADVVFEAALTTLEMVDVGLRSRFSSHLFAHLTSRFQMDAYIYVMSDLRKRCSGDRVALAWRLIEDLYGEHPELIGEDDSTFFVALGDLALEAWEARKRELVGVQGARESDVTPRFVQLLWEKRHGGREGTGVQVAAAPDVHGLEGLGLAEYADLDWEYWNDFLRL